MAVLERRSDAAANRRWLEEKDGLNTLLSGGAVTLASLAPHLRLPEPALKAKLSALAMASLRNRRFLEALLDGMAASGAQVDGASFLDSSAALAIADFQRRRSQDRELIKLARAALALPAVAEALRIGDLAVADTLEYFLVEDLLTRYFNSFSGSRT